MSPRKLKKGGERQWKSKYEAPNGDLFVAKHHSPRNTGRALNSVARGCCVGTYIKALGKLLRCKSTPLRFQSRAYRPLHSLPSDSTQTTGRSFEPKGGSDGGASVELLHSLGKAVDSVQGPQSFPEKRLGGPRKGERVSLVACAIIQGNDKSSSGRAEA